MRAILSEEKKSELDRVTLTGDTLRKYFPKSYTPQRMQDTIIKLLEQWQRDKRNKNDKNVSFLCSYCCLNSNFRGIWGEG